MKEAARAHVSLLAFAIVVDALAVGQSGYFAEPRLQLGNRSLRN